MEKLGVATLAQLVTNRDQLRIELAHAEAALLHAVAHAHARAGEEDPQVEAARLACRRIRAEFTHLEQLVDQTTPPGQIEVLLKELRGLRVEELSARVRGTPQAHPRPTLVPPTSPEPDAAQPPEARRPRRVLGLPLGSLDAKTLRQGLSLLALVLAFLGYYFVDVQLRILTLPSSGIERWYSRNSFLGAPLIGELRLQPLEKRSLGRIDLHARRLQREPLAAVDLGNFQLPS